MAKQKQYRCLNVGNCDKANKKEKFTIPEGEDLKCPECKKEMLQEVKGGLPSWIFALIAVAVIAVCAIVFWPKGGESAEPIDPVETEQNNGEDGGEGYEGTEEYGYEETEEPVDDGEEEMVPDTVVVEKVDTVTVEKVDTVVVEKEKTVVVSNSLTNYNLGWGLYTGEGKSGKPHGIGDVKVTRSYSIDLKSGGKTIDVNNGDKIINAKFDNGKLIRGTVKFTSGTTKYFNIGA